MKKRDLKELIDTQWQYMLVNDLTDDKPYYIGIKNKFDTACWSYNLKRNKHSIYVGDNIFEKVTRIGALGIEHYVESYLHHEVSHSLHTEKDIKTVSDWLKSNKIPFSLFNLLEDARIEYLWRVKTDRLFKWTDYEDIPEIDADSNATSMMFVYIQKEGKWRSRLAKMKRVREYYEEIVDCKSTHDLYPILLKWMEEFPETEQDLDDLAKNGFMGDSSSSPSGSGDLDTSVKLQEDEKLAEEMDEDSEDVIGKSNYADEDNPRELVDAPTEAVQEYTRDSYTVYEEDGNYHFDKQLAKSLMPALMKIFTDKVRKVASVTPSKKLNTRGIAAGKWDKLYKKQEIKAKKKKNVNVFIDCSGSMEGQPIQNARALLYMINSLALKGFTEGHVILTGGSGCDTHTYTMKLPIKERDISSIIANGGFEGVRGTFTICKKLMKKADWNFVFTDGNITDSGFDTKTMTSQGIHTFGLYVGNPEACNLSQWFDKYLARETLKELMEKLIQKLK